MPWRCCRARSPSLLFVVRRRTTVRRQGDVGERRVGRGSMAMFLFRGNVHDVAGDDDLLLRFCGDDALAGGHEQHLITTVSVHFVTRPRAEVDDAQIEVVARLSSVCLTGPEHRRDKGPPLSAVPPRVIGPRFLLPSYSCVGWPGWSGPSCAA